MSGVRYADLSAATVRRQLSESIAAGPTSALARQLDAADALFSLSSDWAPGLITVGATGHCSPDASERILHFSATGAGETIGPALRSCLAELAERMSQVERHRDVAERTPLAAPPAAAMPDAHETLMALAASTQQKQDASADWVAGEMLGTRATVMLPADWCLRRSAPDFALPGAALSTGCAAGPTRAEAAVRALLELVERDAVAMWWNGGRHASPPLETVAAAGEALLERLRGGSDGRRSQLLDITTDLAIPAIAAGSTGPDGRGLVCGFAARFDAADAARAAVMELCQLEVGMRLSVLKRQQLGDAVLSEADRKHLARAAFDSRECSLLRPRGAPSPAPPAEPPRDAGEALRRLAATFADHGVEAALVDVTRPDIAVPVVKVVAPNLQLAPCSWVTPRLRAMIMTTGGAPSPTCQIGVV